MLYISAPLILRLRHRHRCGLEWATALTDDIELWKLSRRLFDPFFRKSELLQYRDRQLSMARSLLVRLVESPERFVHHIH